MMVSESWDFFLKKTLLQKQKMPIISILYFPQFSKDLGLFFSPIVSVCYLHKLKLSFYFIKLSKSFTDVKNLDLSILKLEACIAPLARITWVSCPKSHVFQEIKISCTNLIKVHPRNIHVKFRNEVSGFREENFPKTSLSLYLVHKTFFF